MPATFDLEGYVFSLPAGSRVPLNLRLSSAGASVQVRTFMVIAPDCYSIGASHLMPGLSVPDHVAAVIGDCACESITCAIHEGCEMDGVTEIGALDVCPFPFFSDKGMDWTDIYEKNPWEITWSLEIPSEYR